jgi:anti-sigma regulatory factor (Ser/Thr protein kinase)
VSDLSIQFDPEPMAPASARRVLGRIEGLDRTTLDTARLLVSELVTNSYRHGDLGADDAIELTVRCRPDRLHIEVADPGCGFGPRGLEGDPSPASERGWGLRIVEKLSDRWGVLTNGRTVVWFDVLRDGAGSEAN